MYIKGKYRYRSERRSKTHSPKCLDNREYENLINEYRIEDGYTLKELAESCGASIPFIQKLSQGMASPFTKEGKVLECVEILCILFNVSFAKLFPFEMCEIRRDEETNYLTQDQMENILIGKYTSDTNNYHGMQELRTLVRGILPKLDIGTDNIKRNRDIFIRYFWSNGSTYKGIGNDFGLTGTSIMFIINRGLRLFRHHTRSSKLREYTQREE